MESQSLPRTCVCHDHGFCFVLFPILWCSHTNDHPQEGIAKFGYRSPSDKNLSEPGIYQIWLIQPEYVSKFM
jgi:hypothetical protein